MTTIGIVGLGKMGQAITSLLEAENGTIYHLFPRLSDQKLTLLKTCDVVIEFTTPEASPDVIRHCLMSQIPVVSGTTGWHEYHLAEITTLCQDTNGKFLHASNFSVGMNIVFALNRRLTTILNQFREFVPAIREVHHVHKKDAPSGTALTLIDDIISYHADYNRFGLNAPSNSLEADVFHVTAIRDGDVKGFHEVEWNSGLEKITIAHEAFDRKIFASGAIMAARWLTDQAPGIYTMKDIIRF